MGKKDVALSYNEALPRASRYVACRHPSRLVDVRQELDGLTLSDIIWSPYDSHRVSRSLEPISFFRGFLQYGDNIQMHLPDRVLRQYGYMQTIPPPPLVQDMVAFHTVNACWVHFVDNVVTSMIPAVHPHACTENYIDWYSRVSHPYLIRHDDEGDRRSRSHSEDEDQPASLSQQHQHACPVFYYIEII